MRTRTTTGASAARDGDTVTFEGYANTPDPGRSKIPGDQTYQMQVKRSNLASSTTAEAPIDHAHGGRRG